MRHKIPIIIINIVLLFFITPLFAQDLTVTVTSSIANLKGTPSTSGETVAEVSKGEVFAFITSKNEWFLVQTSRVVGWIHGSDSQFNFASNAQPVNSTSPTAPTKDNSTDKSVPKEPDRSTFVKVSPPIDPPKFNLSTNEIVHQPPVSATAPIPLQNERPLRQIDPKPSGPSTFEPSSRQSTEDVSSIPKITSDRTNNREYLTGSDGKCYYLNNIERKVYVDRGLCGIPKTQTPQMTPTPDTQISHIYSQPRTVVGKVV